MPEVTTPQLIEPIGLQAFELIRDRIAQILTIELASQATLTGDTQLAGVKVFSERFVPMDQTECPSVNVLWSNTQPETDSPRRVDTNNVYAIEVYTKGVTEIGNDSGAVIELGSSAAAKQAARITGVIRAILASPVYKTLFFDTSDRLVSSSRPGRMMSVDTSTFDENTGNIAKAQLNHNVRLCESQEMQAIRALEQLTSEGKVDGGDKGITWEYNQTT